MVARSVTIALKLDASDVASRSVEAAAALELVGRRAREAGDELERLNRKLAESGTAMAVLGGTGGATTASTGLDKVKTSAKGAGEEQEKLAKKTEESGRQFKAVGTETGNLEVRLNAARDKVKELTSEFVRTNDDATYNGLRKARSEVRSLEADFKAATAEAAKLLPPEKKGSSFFGPTGPIARGVGSVVNTSPELAAGIAAAIVVGSPVIGAALDGALLTGIGMGGIALGVLGQLKSPEVRVAATDFASGISGALTNATTSFKIPLIAGLDEVGTAVQNLIKSINFDGLSQEVMPFSHAIAGLVTEIGPGLREAFAASLPLMNEFGILTPRIGHAISDMFHEIATAPGSIEGLRALANITIFLIESIGHLLNTLGGVFVWLQGLEPLMRVLQFALSAVADILGVVVQAFAALGPTATLAIATLVIFGRRIQEATVSMIAFAAASRATAAAQVEAGAATEATSLKMVLFKNAVGGIGAGLGSLAKMLGGPVGIGLIAFTAAIGYVTEREQQYNQSIKDLTVSLESLGTEYGAHHSLATQQFQDLVKNNDVLKDVVANSGKYGFSISVLAQAASGSRPALDQFYAAMKANNEVWATSKGKFLTQDIIDQHLAFMKLAPAITDAYKQAKAYADAQAALALAQDHATTTSTMLSDAARSLGADFAPLVDLMGVWGDDSKKGADVQGAVATALTDVQNAAIPAGDALKVYDIMAKGIAGDTETAAEKTKSFTDLLGAIEHTAGNSADKMSVLVDAFNSIGIAELSATDKAALLGKAWTDLRGPAIDLEKATDGYNKLLLDMQGKMVTNTKGVTSYSGSLDANSRSLSQNNEAGIHNRETLIGLAEASHQLFLADIASGDTTDVARQKEEARNKVLVDQAAKMGLDRTETQKLIDKFKEIPDSKVTTVSVEPKNFATIFDELRNTLVAQHMLMNPGETRAEALRTAAEWLHAAQGGPIVGMGGPKQDNIPVWASVGEFMQQADAVSYYGLPFMQAVNERRVPRDALNRLGDFPTFASGGMVGDTQEFGRYSRGMANWATNWPILVDLSKTKIPPADPFTNWNGTLTPTITTALAFLHAQDGKPYGWAQAGPGSYDCSGIVAAVWNILHNRSPYNHTFSTSDEAGFFPISGGGGVLTAGWANPGERGASATIGHTAASLAGHTFESTGSRGVHLTGVTPIGSFAHVGHFDSGGYLLPGWNAAYNGTGQMEHVSPPRGQFVNGAAAVKNEQNIVFHINGATDPQAVANAVAMHLKQAAKTSDLIFRGG